MTPEEKLQLRDLLKKVAAEAEFKSEDEPLGRPPGFIPEVCLSEYYKVTRTPFLELIIPRESPKGDGTYEYLYEKRKDKWWNGFCAYGGMVRAGYPMNPVEVAQKLLDREFKDTDIKVVMLRIVSFLNWPQHPWCNPFAVPCLVNVDRDIPATGNRQWLSTKALPDNMVAHHGPYLRQCDSFLAHGALCFTPDNPLGLHQDTRGLWLREA